MHIVGCLQSKWVVSAFFGALILWRHDAESLWFAAGSVLNVILSVVLKGILNQERPSTVKSDPGMPSSHAQSIFFFVAFGILSSNFSNLLCVFISFKEKWFINVGSVVIACILHFLYTSYLSTFFLVTASYLST